MKPCVRSRSITLPVDAPHLAFAFYSSHPTHSWWPCAWLDSYPNNNNYNNFYNLNTTLLISSIGLTRFPHPPPNASHESLCSNVKSGRSHPSRRFTVEVGTILIIALSISSYWITSTSICICIGIGITSGSSLLPVFLISVELEPPTVRSFFLPEDGWIRVCALSQSGFGTSRTLVLFSAMIKYTPGYLPTPAEKEG